MKEFDNYMDYTTESVIFVQLLSKKHFLLETSAFKRVYCVFTTLLFLNVSF